MTTAFHDGNVMGITAFGETVWRCFSFNCKLDLRVLQGNLNGIAYRHNMLNAHIPHLLADRVIKPDHTELAL